MVYAEGAIARDMSQRGAENFHVAAAAYNEAREQLERAKREGGR